MAGESRPFTRVGEESDGGRGERKREAATSTVGSHRSSTAAAVVTELLRDPTTPR
jgi:hypothetical protein